jgi:hypothetical protein
MKKLGRILTIFPSLWDAGVFVADKIRARRKARLTPEQRDAAWSEASDRLDDIVDKIDTKREKKLK